MAGLHIRCNPPFGGKDELAGAPIKRNSIPAIFCAPTPAPAQALAPTSAPASASASALGPPGRYTDEDLQRATKLALESFIKDQENGQLQANFAPRKQPLKAQFFNLYYENSHLDYYRFC